MTSYVTKHLARIAAMKLASANLSIGTASTFVLATALLSLVFDRPAPSPAAAAAWQLRGALGQVDAVPVPTARPTPRNLRSTG